MIAFAGHTRAYTVPGALVASAGDNRLTGWELLALSSDPRVPEDTRAWASRVVDTILTEADALAHAALDCSECEDIGFYGIEDQQDPDTLRMLLKKSEDDGGYDQLTASGWVPFEVTDGTPARLLTREVAEDLAAVIATGGTGLTLRYVTPIAWLPPSNDLPVTSLTAAATAADKGDGWLNYAIVDELDLGAVLNLIRLAKGPKLEAFTAAGWAPDTDLLTDLRGVNPPMLVELDDAMYQSVVEQIKSTPLPDPKATTAAAAAPASDRAVSLPDGSYPIRNKVDLRKAIRAYGRAKDTPKAKRHIIKRARALDEVAMLPESWGLTASSGFPDEQACAYCSALATQRIIHSEGLAYVPTCDDHLEDGTADAETCTPDGQRDPGNIVRIEVVIAAVSPDPRAEKLRRYWSIGGKGGAKIRWGTHGDWRRCVRYLSKYMGPRAKGYCQNMHKRNTGVSTGSRLNASATRPNQVMSTEESLSAALASGMWLGTNGKANDMQDGIYSEVIDADAEVLDAVVAGGFPIAPPDEWFSDPKLSGPQPLTIDPSGQVYGHIATFDVAHIGMPGKVHAPRSRSGYAYFKTGELLTASGSKVPVGNLTLAGGHAPLSADASGAVAHYDNTASAIADVNVGEDRFGIWVAGALRPEASAEQVRALRASAPSGDWRPINGRLELVAVCQVNVPGFPVTRARVASGAVMALVAAGAKPLAEQRFAALADAAMAARLEQMESVLIASGLMAGDTTVIGEDLSGFEEQFAEPEIQDVVLEAAVPDDISSLEETAAAAETVAEVPPVDTIADEIPDEPEVAPVDTEEDAPAEEIVPEPEVPEIDPEHAAKIEKLRAEIAANKRRDALRMRARRPELVMASASVSDSRQQLRDRVRPESVTAGVKFLEWMHPRGRNGQWIEKFSFINVGINSDGSGEQRRAKVVGLQPAGMNVEYQDTRGNKLSPTKDFPEFIKSSEITAKVESADNSSARLPGQQENVKTPPTSDTQFSGKRASFNSKTTPDSRHNIDMLKKGDMLTDFSDTDYTVDHVSGDTVYTTGGGQFKRADFERGSIGRSGFSDQRDPDYSPPKPAPVSTKEKSKIPVGRSAEGTKLYGLPGTDSEGEWTVQWADYGSGIVARKQNPDGTYQQRSFPLESDVNGGALSGKPGTSPTAPVGKKSAAERDAADTAMIKSFPGATDGIMAEREGAGLPALPPEIQRAQAAQDKAREKRMAEEQKALAAAKAKAAELEATAGDREARQKAREAEWSRLGAEVAAKFSEEDVMNIALARGAAADTEWGPNVYGGNQIAKLAEKAGLPKDKVDLAVENFHKASQRKLPKNQKKYLDMFQGYLYPALPPQLYG